MACDVYTCYFLQTQDMKTILFVNLLRDIPFELLFAWHDTDIKDIKNWRTVGSSNFAGSSVWSLIVAKGTVKIEGLLGKSFDLLDLSKNRHVDYLSYPLVPIKANSSYIKNNGSIPIEPRYWNFFLKVFHMIVTFTINQLTFSCIQMLMFSRQFREPEMT